MVSLKEIFDHLRVMSGGTLTQLQVDATNNVISTMGVEVISNVLGETAPQGCQLTEATLRKLHSTADVEFVSIINKHAFNFGITNKKRMAMFLSHAMHESNGFNTLQESFNYKPARLKAVFGFRIPSLNFATNLLAKGPPITLPATNPKVAQAIAILSAPSNPLASISGPKAPDAP